MPIHLPSHLNLPLPLYLDSLGQGIRSAQSLVHTHRRTRKNLFLNPQTPLVATDWEKDGSPLNQWHQWPQWHRHCT